MYSIIIVLLFSFVHSWDLSEFGTNVTVSHVTMYQNRAFLCVPRESTKQNITLLETLWPENDKAIKSSVKVFPATHLQESETCKNIQSSVSTVADTLGRLFVLDRGWGLCQPKVMVFDLRTGQKITHSELTGVPNSQLHTIVVDIVSLYGTRAYIGDPGDGHLIVYNYKDRHWWRVYLSPPPGTFITSVPSYDMAMSTSMVVPVLYLTADTTDKLFSIQLANLRNFAGPAAIFSDTTEFNATTIPVKLEGSKLGKSTALAVDSHNGVYYFLPRDYACVRWDSRQLMAAESHDIILQSAHTLPYVHQIFTDKQKQVWALLGSRNQFGSYCIKLRNYNFLHTL